MESNSIGGKVSPKSTKKLSTEEFIRRSKSIHGDRYDYSKVNYINSYTKVCIVCPEHGEFFMQPRHHLRGEGCPNCRKNKQYSTSGFIVKAKAVHGNRYDYSKTIYVSNKKDIIVICPEHGEFLIRPDHHLSGEGCAKCVNKNKSRTTEEFISLAKDVHKDRYDYSKVEYVNCYTPVCIICKTHGEFWQEPQKHLVGCGCPFCQNSILENNVYKLLLDNKIKFQQQQTFDWLRYDKPLRLDFFLPDYNIAIECQGIQHFESIEFFGGDEMFELCMKRDKIKYDTCKNHGIKLLYITNIIRETYPYDVIIDLGDLIKIIRDED